MQRTRRCRLGSQSKCIVAGSLIWDVGPYPIVSSMEQLTATNFASLHTILCEFRKDKRWVFRGHSDSGWELVPKSGRFPFSTFDDRQIFESWKRRAVEHVRILPKSDWEWLAIAQHHGLATRLLDWTTNPLNAAYFAVRENHPADAVIYAARFKLRVTTDAVHPMGYCGVATYWPSGVVPRITRQGGLFTVHGEPSVPLEATKDGSADFVRITIPRESRDSLLRELSYYGINAVTLFPDLDGLSAFLNWTMVSKEYWNLRPDALAQHGDSGSDHGGVPPNSDTGGQASLS